MNEPTEPSAERGPLELLAPFRSWQLQRVSVATFPQDVVATLRRKGQPPTEAEIRALTNLIRSGECYRCRIGKGRYFFGDTARAAAELAAAAAQPSDSEF